MAEIKMSEKKTAMIVAIIFVLVGVMMSALSVDEYVDSVNYKNNSIEASAAVTDVTSYTDSDYNETYRVYVRYSVNGVEYNGSYSVSDNSPVKSPGDSVKIRYAPDNPGKVLRKGNMFKIVMFMIFGVLFFSLGALILISGVVRLK